MKRTIHIVIISLALFASLNLYAQTPKYVFFMITDGMGINAADMARLYNQSQGDDTPLIFRTFPVHSYLTSNPANALVTDSAAAATALCCGEKTANGYLGVDPEGNSLESLAVLAKRKGKGVALVTTDATNQATPSAFHAHTKDRNDKVLLHQSLIDSECVDFATGSYMVPSKSDGRTIDDWVAEARNKGVNIFRGKEQYRKVKGEKVIYLSALETSQLTYVIDNHGQDLKLSDFTGAAIDYLDTNFGKKGFFAMIEAGNTDHAAHLRDAAATIAEINEFNKALGLVMDFCAAHKGQCLVVMASDHETGGICLSEGKPGYLAHQTCSADALSRKVSKLREETGNKVSWYAVKDVLSENLGLWTEVPVTKEQEEEMYVIYLNTFLKSSDRWDVNLYSKTEKIAQFAVRCLDENAGVLWGTSRHSAAPTPLFAWGVRAIEFAECKDQTDVPGVIARIAGY